jgi:hypothetical protein
MILLVEVSNWAEGSGSSKNNIFLRVKERFCLHHGDHSLSHFAGVLKKKTDPFRLVSAFSLVLGQRCLGRKKLMSGLLALLWDRESRPFATTQERPLLPPSERKL